IDRQQQTLERASHPGVEAPDRAEVQQAQMSVTEEEDVARMGGGVEYPVDHDLAQETVEELVSQNVSIVCALAGLDCRDGPSIQALHHQDSSGGHRLDRNRDAHERVSAVGRGGSHRCHVARLDAKVDLFAQGVAKTVGQIDGTHRSTPAPIEASSEALEDGEI